MLDLVPKSVFAMGGFVDGPRFWKGSCRGHFLFRAIGRRSEPSVGQQACCSPRQKRDAPKAASWGKMASGLLCGCHSFRDPLC